MHLSRSALAAATLTSFFMLAQALPAVAQSTGAASSPDDASSPVGSGDAPPPVVATPPPPSPPPPPPPPPSTPEARAVSTAAPVQSCIGRVDARARGAVVRVESGLRVGAGFVAVDSSHVITSAALVAEGHDVRVVDVEGNARNARVIATAPDDDLALLELAAPLSARPLEIAAWDEIEVGREVVTASFTLGRARHRRSRGAEFDFSLTAGAINARGDRFLQADVRAGATGSPMLDCGGAVVGVVSHQMLDEGPFTMGVGAGAVSDLASRVDRPEGHSGRVRLTLGIGLSMAFEDLPTELEPDLLVGAYVSVGLRVFDSFVINARGHGLFGGSEPSGSEVLRRSAARFRGDGYLAWRQLVVFAPGMGMHFELGLGASVTLARDTARSLDLSTGAPRFLDATTEVWRARPMAVFNIEMNHILIGYTFEVEIEGRNGHAYHVWTLGLQL